MISVIIPLYNKKTAIHRTVESVLKQSNNEFEIIVVDDGSTDGSGDMLSDIKDERVRYFKKENGGVSSARNFGIDKSTGEWLLFLDADDELAPCSMRIFEHCSKKFPQHKVFVGGTARGPLSNNEHAYVESRIGGFFSIWINRFLPHAGNMLVHRSVVQKYGGYDERMSFFEDYEFCLRMMLSGKVVYTSSPVCVFHKEDCQLSVTKHNKEKDMAYYVAEQLSRYPFWGKTLWYENLEYMLFWNEDNVEEYAFYEQLKCQSFGAVHYLLHQVRQRLSNYGLI